MTVLLFVVPQIVLGVILLVDLLDLHLGGD